ncbi:cysteine desulfurase family protein [Kordiimonas aquimaris]|uniref:cysteine desulfurase family protein n=1 Tax=Kordiimonas aquimaris TaxID=707591 RepID=UPI0021D1250C|nr:cysteine desulfurase family protein [Kordiimonas aquimaris]
MNTPIYIDYNATAPIRENVITVVADTMRIYGNPSSVHAAGRKARGIVEEARAKVAALVAARTRDVTFCSGGTEANNAVIKGSGSASVIVSAIEHDSGLAAAKQANIPCFVAPVDENGVIDLEKLQLILADAPKPALVSVMLVNNETGVIQPVAETAALTHEYGGRMHTDAVQAAGKLTINFGELGVDYLTLSSHKIGGPQGVGAIVTSSTAPLRPMIVGGGQELGRRSGTENVAGIAGFGVAAIETLEETGNAEFLSGLRDRFEEAVAALNSDAIIVGANAARVANTSCVAMPGVRGETQTMHFDLKGICLSSGSACSSGKVKVSHVLSAMGFDDGVAEASIRVSLGRLTKESDIDALIDAWTELYKRTAKRQDNRSS